MTPSSSVFSSTFFSSCWAAQPGVLRAQALCWEMVLSASNCNSNFSCNWLQLTRTLCGTGLYNCLSPTCFLWVSHLHRIQPVHGQGYILISSTGCTCSVIDGWVEDQYVTLLPILFLFISSSWIFRLVRCFVLVFSSQHILMSFFSLTQLLVIEISLPVIIT